MNRSADWRTPTLAVNDARGLPVRQVAYLREAAGQAAIALVTRQTHNASGALVAQQDPRLPTPNLSTVYNLTGAALKVDSVDAGGYVSLPGLAGEILQRWSARGDHWRTRHDAQLRILEVEENAIPAVEVFTYGTAMADANRNLRGQLLKLKDPSGSLEANGYSLQGALLQETRRFADGQAFDSSRRFSPQGALLEQVDAGGHRQQSGYDQAGQLRSLRLQLNGQSDWQTVLEDAHYNAATQIVEQHSGNGVISQWHYDPASARLHRQHSGKASAARLQDFEYVYDPVGNITRIVDHVFTPSHFANQRVEGDRSFAYNTLYQLVSASGYDDAPAADNPGLPQPADPADRRNYTQTYDYDAGGNLTRLVHVRDGGGYTRQMRIDPASNRGVRWAEGDPNPDFGKLFDAHGNLLALQPGQELQWNARNQLVAVTLVKRDSGQDDVEHYHYSQGARVHKRLDTVPGHFHDVRYLPGLEIRTKDNGEELHVITLAGGSGSVRCLHWENGKPAGIDNDQLRYTVDDHLGSSVMELDSTAQRISHEGYYPYGATAWMTTRSNVEVGYKTVRYSGKEMDISGLYYYGARYYAPWLQRWVSADPALDVDGLNLYTFVGGNPLRYVDFSGQNKYDQQVVNFSAFLDQLGTEAATGLAQIDGVIKQNVAKELAKNLAGETVGAIIGFFGGYYGSELFGKLAPDLNKIPYVGGLVGGNAGGDLAVDSSSPFDPTARLIRPLVPQTSAMSISAIDQRLGFETGELSLPTPAEAALFFMNRIVGSVVPAIGAILNLGSRAQEAEDIGNRLDPAKIAKIDTLLKDWKSSLDKRWELTRDAYNRKGTTIVYPGDLLPNVNSNTPKELLAPIRMDELEHKYHVVRDYIERGQRGMRFYKDIGTTDNQWILHNPEKAKARGLKLALGHSR